MISTEIIFALALSAPAVVLGLCEKNIKPYGVIASIAYLVLILYRTPIHLCYLALYVTIQYAAMKSVRRLVKAKGRTQWIYWSHILLSLLPLIIYKVTGLYGGNVFGFIGISYMTFRSLQIILEVYDGIIDDIKFIDFIYFMCFMPSIICGPIDRSRRFLADTEVMITRGEYLENIAEAIQIILIGAFYKYTLSGLCSLIGFQYIYTYGFYMFFDFAGYSLIAIGIGLLFGIRLPDNFKNPFVSVDIKEFWNRWHISLSTWFRDYLFSRMLRRAMRGKWFGGNRLAEACTCLITNMTIMGIWHGLSANYIIYGIYHGLLLAVTEIYHKKSAFYKKHRKSGWYKGISWFITFNSVMLGFYIFKG